MTDAERMKIRIADAVDLFGGWGNSYQLNASIRDDTHVVLEALDSCLAAHDGGCGEIHRASHQFSVSLMMLYDKNASKPEMFLAEVAQGLQALKETLWKRGHECVHGKHVKA